MNSRSAYLAGRSALARLKSVIIAPVTAPSGTSEIHNFAEGVDLPHDQLGIFEYFQIRQTVLFIPQRRNYDIIVESWQPVPQEYVDHNFANDDVAGKPLFAYRSVYR